MSDPDPLAADDTVALGSSPLARTALPRSWPWAAALFASAMALAAAATVVLTLSENELVAVLTGIAALVALGLALEVRARRLLRLLAAAREAQLECERLAALGLTTAGFAHELKNGVMVAHGFAELALKAATQQQSADPKLVAHVREIEAQTGRMAAQLRSFLRLARGPADAQTKRPMEEVLGEIVRLGQPLARMKQLELATEIDASLGRTVDDPGFRGALLNLLLNALDHARTVVRLSARASDSGVELAVADDGPGVPPSLRRRLFEHFATGRRGGTGLGLAAAREAVEREGGSLTCEDAPGGGAKFVIRLPRAR